jgi:hypothetical protein
LIDERATARDEIISKMTVNLKENLIEMQNNKYLNGRKTRSGRDYKHKKTASRKTDARQTIYKEEGRTVQHQEPGTSKLIFTLVPDPVRS